jgi:hypothetical protein
MRTDLTYSCSHTARGREHPPRFIPPRPSAVDEKGGTVSMKYDPVEDEVHITVTPPKPAPKRKLTRSRTSVASKKAKSLKATRK